MRVLSTGTCDTLSGSSKLTYHIGMHAGRRDLPARAQQHRRRLLQSGVDLAAGHPDGTEETSGREAHHVHPAESPPTGQVGQHAGVPDGGPAAREIGSFDAGKAPETRAGGSLRIHGQSRQADGVRRPMRRASLQSLEATPPRKPPSRRKHQLPSRKKSKSV